MKKKFELSSGNVFADLNLPNPEEALTKAELARQINNVIKKKKLTKKKVATELGIDISRILDLESGKLSEFSLEMLFRFLNELGQDVIISVKSKARSNKKGSLSIALAGAISNPARR